MSPSFALSCHAFPVPVPISLVAFSLPVFLRTAGLCFCISLLWRMQTGGAEALLKEAKQARQEPLGDAVVAESCIRISLPSA